MICENEFCIWRIHEERLIFINIGLEKFKLKLIENETDNQQDC